MPERIDDQLTSAIAAIGEVNFPEHILGLLHAITGADLCSAFEIASDSSLRLLFAAGEHPEIPDFAETASLAYARTFWQRDSATRRALATAPDAVHVVRQAWNGISDPDYRRTCYERGGIIERLTLYGASKPGIFASAYRTRESGHTNPAQLEALDHSAPWIMALIGKHAQVMRRASRTNHVPSHDIAQQLIQRSSALSAREANVAAALFLGKSQGEIAMETGIAVSSVITYRRRAYRKLGVSTRRDLRDLLDAKPTFIS